MALLGTGTRKRRSGQPFRVGLHSCLSRAFRLYEGQRLHPGALQKFGSLVTGSALADSRAAGPGSFKAQVTCNFAFPVSATVNIVSLYSGTFISIGYDSKVAENLPNIFKLAALLCEG